MRAGIVAMVLFVAAVAQAEVVRLRFRGVQAIGPAPAKLDRTVESHLAVALKQRGTELAARDPVDAEAGARCTFTGTFGAHTANCLVEVVRPADGLRAERRAEIPFRDAEDFAETLSLLVADMVATDLRDALVAAPHEPEPAPAPAPKPPPPIDKLIVHPVKPKGPPPPTAVHLGAGPVLGIGFTGEPLLAGAVVRAFWSRGPLRLGGTLSLAGGGSDPAPWHLGFFRLLTAARVGAGLERGPFGFDATLGPALLMLATDAHVPDGKHTLATFAGVGGVRLAVRLAHTLVLALDADVVVAAHRESVEAAGIPVQVFGLGSLELALTLAYRL